MAKRGERLSPEVRAKISDAQRARHRRVLEERTVEPEFKRCSKCREIKPVASFTTVRRKLKCGLTVVRPLPSCKRCKADEVAARRQREREEGIDVAARQRRYYATRDKTKARAYAREWGRAKRREEGRPERGPYRRKDGRKDASDDAKTVRMPTAPLAALLEAAVQERGYPAIEAATGLHARRLSSVLRCEYPTVTLRVIDKVLTGLGCPEQMPILYPDTTVGYHVLSE